MIYDTPVIFCTHFTREDISASGVYSFIFYLAAFLGGNS